jgi:hypothetical protein
MTRRMARQGDLLFLAIDDLPKGLKLQDDNVIVRGEATGHAHRLQVGQVYRDVQGMQFLKVQTPTQVVHEEHHPISLEPGYYQVVHQREYTPDASRIVRD